MVMGIGWLMKMVFLGSTLMSVSCNGGMSEEAEEMSGIWAIIYMYLE